MQTTLRSAIALGLLASLCGSLAAQRAIGSFSGSNAGDQLGCSVAVAGDVDGDGFDDLVVGAPLADNNGPSSGHARVLSGGDGSVLYSFDGDDPVDEFGAAVSGAGDVNGDGRADVIVGAPRDDDGGIDAGRATVYSGADGTVLYAFDGDAPGDLFGESVGGAGDVNRDGYADVIVGARFADNNGTSSGRAVVRSGFDGSVLHSFDGDAAFDFFGTSVSGAGDVNDDGFADVIVGGPNDDNNGVNSGCARVFSGVDGSQLWAFTGDSAGDLLGWSVSGAGDVNADGFDDVIAGAPGDDDNGSASGSARVFSGQDGSTLYTFSGDDSGDDFGRSVGGARDVNADGFADLVVGAPLDGAAGTARVLSGQDGSTLFTFVGNTGSAFGTSVGGGGDFNCDGYGDMVIGAPQDDGSAGNVRALSGADGTLLQSTGIGTGDALGSGVTLLADLDTDGFAELLVGIPGDDTAGLDAGNVKVLSGADGSVLFSFEGDDAGDALGTSVASAGDVNNDGVEDIVAGAPGDDDNGSSSGSARVFSGADGSVLYTFLGNSSADEFGIAVAGAGDVNNDNFDDVIVGAPGDDPNGPDSGSAVVFSGADGSVLYTFAGDSSADRFGTSVDSAGDVDSNAFDDIVVGAPGDDNTAANAGSVRVFSGIDGSTIYTFDGDSADDAFGTSVSGAGDINNDTFPDIAVGAPGDDNTGTDAGSVRVLSGKNGATVLDLDGTATGDAFGSALSGIGDVDADGFADFVVGAPGDDSNGDEAGSARVHTGRTGAELFTVDGSGPGDRFGSAVHGGQDVDGDGKPDFATGAAAADTDAIDGGEARVSTTCPKVVGKVSYFASPCPTSTGSLPQIVASRPLIRQTLSIEMQAGPASSPSALHIDVAVQNIDLFIFGSPGCTLVALPFFGFNSTTDGNGAATINLPIPGRTSLIGQSLFAQWIALDAGSNLLVVSNAATLTFGSQ